jgi:hypothetical protein
MPIRRAWSLLLLGFALGAAGCAAFGVGRAPAPTSQLVAPYPGGCAAFDFAPRRCSAIVELARRQAGIDDASVAVELVSPPPPDCGTTPTGQRILCTTSGAGTIGLIVRFTPATGGPTDVALRCGFDTAFSIACTATPEARITTPMEGYRDITCSGEDANHNPTGCSTPVPSAEPAAAAAAHPLSIARLDIPIEVDGPEAVLVGTVDLPNGRLSDATLELATRTLPDVVLDTDGVRLEVRSRADGRPFQNLYEHGWSPGVERADVVLVFNVIQHEPGAVLPIRDLAVR